MTPKGAFKVLKNTLIRTRGCNVAFSKALHLAMAALEKQIPKKPKRRKDTTYLFCPCCDSGNLMNDYCTDCGQKIDWSDT